GGRVQRNNEQATIEIADQNAVVAEEWIDPPGAAWLRALALNHVTIHAGRMSFESGTLAGRSVGPGVGIVSADECRMVRIGDVVYTHAGFIARKVQKVTDNHGLVNRERVRTRQMDGRHQLGLLWIANVVNL